MSRPVRGPALRRSVVPLVSVAVAVALTSSCGVAGRIVGVQSPPAHPVPGAALEPQQARGIVGRVLPAANAADKARDATKARAAYDGLALQMVTALYQVDIATGSTVPVRPASSTRPIVLLTRGTAYPRFFYAVLPGTAKQAPVVLLLTAHNAGSAYRIAGSVTLLPGARLPEVADPAEGSPRLTSDTTGLAVAPQDLAPAYAAVLNNGTTAPEAANFTKDTFVDQVQKTAAAQRQGVARFGTYVQTHQAVPGGTLAVRTSNGGALVFTELRRTSTFRARSGNAATLPPDVRVLTGEVQASTFTTTAAELLMFVVPPAGKGKATLVAAADGLVAAKAG
jgi:hypothetical protein